MSETVGKMKLVDHRRKLRTNCLSHRLSLKKCKNSTHETAAIGGWETLSEVQRYTKGAERKRLAQRVINAREKGQK